MCAGALVKPHGPISPSDSTARERGTRKAVKLTFLQGFAEGFTCLFGRAEEEHGDVTERSCSVWQTQPPYPVLKMGGGSE